MSVLDVLRHPVLDVLNLDTVARSVARSVDVYARHRHDPRLRSGFRYVAFNLPGH